MYDIIIINLPGIISRTPPAAPALLKACIEQHGFTCRTIDFNIKFYHSNIKNIKELETYFVTELNVEESLSAELLIKAYVDEVISLNPKYVAISVFTYQNRVATKLFCELIKKKTGIKIILGGQGLSDGGILGKLGWAKDLMQNGLCDFYIKSEGEKSLVELLKGNFDYPGINSDTFDQINKLDNLPIPDYSDYQIDLYDQSLPITGSRGCVRSCSFCDIHDHWEYRLRSGESISNEIIKLYKKYNINTFQFTDSLINGSLKEFKIFCQRIADYNKITGAGIKYSGQYIVRASNQLDETYWENLAASGANLLAIGVETGSDRVRHHMNKKFTNKDLDYTMEKLQKYNISCVFLMIFGYPTETLDDFNETLLMFEKYKSYANKIIKHIEFGSSLSILPGTPLYQHAKLYNIELDRHENNWIAFDNPSLTLQERIRRRNLAKEYAISLGYKIDYDLTENVVKMIEKNLPKLNNITKIKKMINIKSTMKSSHQ